MTAAAGPPPLLRFACTTAGERNYFGPLVVLACFLDPQVERAVAATGLGRADLSKLRRGQIRGLAKKLRILVPHESVRLGPEKFNQLRAKMEGREALLAWAHGKALTPLARAFPACTRVLCDRVSPGEALDQALRACGGAPEVVPVPGPGQEPEGVPELALRAAWVLAQELYLEAMTKLSETHGVTLPTDPETSLATAKLLFSRGGMSIMRKLAKLDLEITESLA